MLSSNKTISVIIPVHNGERFLKEAIDSVLQQLVKPTEVIVVDDGSTDGSANIAQSYAGAVNYLFQENGGAAKARNHGVSVAKGDYLAFLDADDLWLPDKLEKQFQVIKDHPTANAIFGHMQQFVSATAGMPAQTLEKNREILPGYSPCTLLISKDNFLKVGLFETTWKVGEFIAWFARAQDIGLQIMMIPDVVALRRIHDQNQGVQKRDMRLDYALIVKSIRDRRQSAEASQRQV